MAPPPVPFFRGRTVSASEKDGLIAVRPLAGHAFASPPGTRELYLPTVTMVRVIAEPLDEDGQAKIDWLVEVPTSADPSGGAGAASTSEARSR